MLDDLKAQKIYTALKSSSGLHSPAADKAISAKGQADDLGNAFDSTSKIPDGSALPAAVPQNIKDAADTLKTYKTAMGSTSSAAGSLSDAIGQRMDDATGSMAIMSTAVSVAQKMGEVDGGCGPIGAAFSVLTSTGRTDLLLGLMGQAADVLGEIGTLFNKYLGGGSMSAEDKARLAALMASLKSIMASIGEATAGITALVAEAQGMWNKLESIFKSAIQSSILASMLNNPCMRGVADAIVPDSVRDVMASFD